MDLVLNVYDHYILTPYVYPASWAEDNPQRQILSLLLLTYVGAVGVYLGLGALNYFFIFDHNLMKHPHFLKNQVRREITYTMNALPWVSIPTAAVFFAEVRGYSKLYDNVSDSPLGWPGLFLSMIFFLLSTDMCNYWIHRILHHKLLYKHFHKGHHIWKVPSPFASHTLHPVDGLLQGLPYLLYPFFFPLHKVLFLALYIFINVWSISIHDGDYRLPSSLTNVINGSAHHTDHHLFFDYNYGAVFSLWDRMWGSYRYPSALMGKGPHDMVRKLQAEGKLGGDGAKSNIGHNKNRKKE